MASKRKALGRGYDSLIPSQTVVSGEAKQGESVAPSVREAAALIADATQFMDKHEADGMLHLIIRLC